MGWNPNGTSSVEISLTGDQTNIYDYQGNLIESLDSDAKTKWIELNDSPKFIECVQHRVVVDSVSYNKDKNLITVTGRSNMGDTVNVSLKKEDVVKDSKMVVVKDGNFTLTFSPMESGDYTVYAGTEQVNDTGNVSISFGNEKSFVNTGTLAVYDAESKSITISGSIANYQNTTNSTIAAVKSGKKAPYTKDNLLYVGQTDLSGGKFIHSFKFESQTPGKYDIILGGTDIETPVIETLNILPDKDYYAELESSAVTESTVSAKVNLSNYSNEEKNAVLIICQYDKDKRLVSAETYEKKVPKMNGDTPGTESISGSMAFKNGAKYFKAYVWESLDNGKPVSNPISLK